MFFINFLDQLMSNKSIGKIVKDKSRVLVFGLYLVFTFLQYHGSFAIIYDLSLLWSGYFFLVSIIDQIATPRPRKAINKVVAISLFIFTASSSANPLKRSCSPCVPPCWYSPHPRHGKPWESLQAHLHIQLTRWLLVARKPAHIQNS